MANTVGTLNLLQSVVDHGLELEKFDTAGTSEEYGNVRESVAHHHDFDDDGSLILHERSPINPKSIYATSEGRRRLPDDELPRRVRRARRRHADVQQLRPPTEPALRHRARSSRRRSSASAIELGQLEPMRDFCFCTDGVRGHLTVAAHGVPGDVYVYGQGENISMRDWADLILRVGEEEGYWAGREIVSTPRALPARSRARCMALRVGYEKLQRETGWEPKVSWEEGIRRTIAWYAANRDRWIGRVDWLAARAATWRRDERPRHGRRRLPRLARRRAARARRVRAVRRRAVPTTTSPRRTTRRASSRRRSRSSSSTSPPRSAVSARTASTAGGTGTRTLMMGANVLEQSRLHEVDKLVVVGTICSYPKLAPRPFREESLWDGYPEETNAPLRRRQEARCSSAGRPTGSSTGSTASTCSRSISTARATTSTSSARTSFPRSSARCSSRQDEVVLWGDGTPTREFLYVEDAAEGIVLAARALRRRRAGQPRQRRRRSRSASWPSSSPTSPASRARSSGTPRSRTGSRGGIWTSRGRRSASGSARGRRSGTDSSGRSPGTARRF